MRRGFTLFELLLVTVVIGLLVASVMKFSSIGRENAYDAQCKSNLRSLAHACVSHAMSKGEFPWGMRTVDGYTSYGWDFVKRDGSSAWEPGELWGGLNIKSVVSCPKCRAENDNWDGCGYTGYNYNCAYVGKVEGDPGARKKPLRWSRVTQAARLLLFGDAGYAGGMNKFMRAPVSDPLFDSSSSGLREAGTQAFRHRGHANLAFADGHVESCGQPYKLSGAKGFVHERTKTAFVDKDNALYGSEAIE